MDIDDDDNIQITDFINKNDVFLSPELKAANRIPFGAHYKTIYYSFGKLLLAISSYPFDISDCLSEEPVKRAIRFP